MIWLLVVVMTVVFIGLFEKLISLREKGSANADGALVGQVASILIAIVVVLSALCVASNDMRAQIDIDQLKQAAIAQCDAAYETRGARYDFHTPESALVGGSIENIKQSTVLSQAIEQCHSARSRFNCEVAKQQAIKTSVYGIVMRFRFLIPSSVMDMEYLTGSTP